MAALTVITKILDNVNMQEKPVELPVWLLNTYLQNVPAFLDALLCHQEFMKTNPGSDDPSLKRLCDDVLEHNIQAATKLKQAYELTTNASSSPGNFWTQQKAVLCRSKVLTALEEIRGAYNNFSIVSTDGSLSQPQARQVVLAHLRKTYSIMIMIGRILEPFKDEDWLAEFEQYFEKTNLWDFKFDHGNDYPASLKGKFLEEVIVNAANTPSNCLSAFPQPPTFALHTGPYGARIHLNEYPGPAASGGESGSDSDQEL